MEKKKITYIKQDLFTSLKPNSNIVVCHITNIFGIFGSGFAASVREIYPKTNAKYVEKCRFYDLNDYRPMVFFTPEDFGFFANMTCQTSFGAQRNASYADLVTCMEDVVTFCEQSNITKLYCPKFGAGTCGLNWDFIEALIEDIWISSKLNVTVFVL